MTLASVQCIRVNMFNMRHELYGESVFTSFRIFSGKIFGATQHVERLYNALKTTYKINGLSYDGFVKYFDLNKALRDLSLNHPNSYVRITFYSSAEVSLSLKNFGLGDLEMDIKCRQIKDLDSHLKLLSMPYPYSHSYMPVKDGSYILRIKDKRDASFKGYDDVLYIQDGFIVELSTSNVVFFKKDHFYTPAGDNFLKGITLKNFENFCLLNKFQFELQNIKMTDLYQFDGAFALNAVRLMDPIIKIDTNVFDPERIKSIKHSFHKYCMERF